MVYFRAWYRKSSESNTLDPHYPEWVVYAMDEDQARSMVLQSIERQEPERGFEVLLSAIADEDEGTIAFASARQSGQALM